MPSKRNLKSKITCKFCSKTGLIRLQQHLDCMPQCKHFYNTSYLRSKGNGKSTKHISTQNQQHISSTSNELSSFPCNTSDNLFYESNNNEIAYSEEFLSHKEDNNLLDLTFPLINPDLINPDPINTLSVHSSNQQQVSNLHVNDDEEYVLHNDDNDVVPLDSMYDFSYISEKMQLLQNNNSTYTVNQLISLKLYDMCRRVNAPLNFYKDIRKLFDVSIPKLIGDSPPYLTARNELIRGMHSQIFSGVMNSLKRKRKSKKRNSIDTNTPINKYKFDLKHRDVPVRLQHTSVVAKVPVFDLVSQIASLLQDPFLMRLSNTLYHKKSFYDPVSNISPSFDDIDSSDWFKDAHNYIVRDKEIEILCPIILFIDGTPIDSYGRSSLEPVMFTLGIFNRKVRNLDAAWRVLGFVPNTEKSCMMEYNTNTKEGSRMKKIHYHQLLQEILNQISNLQKNGGMKWYLKYPNNVFRSMIMRFAVMVVIGDCLGNDKFCSRIQNYIPTKLYNTGACRDCNVTYKHCDDHDFKCNNITRELIHNASNDVLKQLSFYNIGINCFDNICFGGDIEGINGSTPPEPLHQWYLGVVSFIVGYFLDRLTSKAKAYLNEVIKEMSKVHSRQSDRDMPTISTFKVGIDKTKLTGVEKGTQVFMIYLSLLPLEVKKKIVSLEAQSPSRYKVIKITDSNNKVTKTRKKYKKLIDDNNKFNQWLVVFEDMLSIGEWLSCSSHTISKDSVEDCLLVDLYCLDKYDSWVQAINDKSVNDNRYEEEHLNVDDIEDEEDVLEINEDEIIDRDDVFFQSIDNEDDLSTTYHDLMNEDAASIHSDDGLLKDDFELSDEEDSDIDPGSMLDIPIVKKQFLISKAEYGIRVFMKNVKKVIHRNDHDRLKTVKFHQLLHLVRYVKKYGSPSNINGGIPERILKSKAKHPGKHTQQRHESINSQTSTRVAEDQIVSQGLSIALEANLYSQENGWDSFFVETAMKDFNDLEINPIDEVVNQEMILHEGSGIMTYTFEVSSAHVGRGRRTQHGIGLDKIDVVYEKKYQYKSVPILEQERRMKNIIKTIYNQLGIDERQVRSGSMKLFNYIKIDGMIFRASYSYYGQDNWFDWCNVTWDVGGTLPSKILGIVDAKTFVENLSHISMNEIELPEGNIWLVVQSSKVESYENYFTAGLAQLMVMEERYRLISVDEIAGPCFVVRNTDYSNGTSTHDTTFSTKSIVIKPRHSWAKLLINKFETSNL